MLLKVRAQAAQEQQQQAGADDAAATAATIHATAVLVFPVEQLPADVICATAVFNVISRLVLQSCILT